MKSKKGAILTKMTKKTKNRNKTLEVNKEIRL